MQQIWKGGHQSFFPKQIAIIIYLSQHSLRMREMYSEEEYLDENALVIGKCMDQTICGAVLERDESLFSTPAAAFTIDLEKNQ